MSHDISWWSTGRALSVSTHGSIWNNAFADGSATPADDAMQAAWEPDLKRIEGFLDGNVGTHHPAPAQAEDADGFGGAGPKLRGYNFRDRAFTDVFSLQTQDPFAVMLEPRLDGGAGVDPSPLPGGTLRFYVGRGGQGGGAGTRQDSSFTSPPVAVWVYYSATIVFGGYDVTTTGTADDFYFKSRLNGHVIAETKIRWHAVDFSKTASNQVSISWTLPVNTLPGNIHGGPPDSMHALTTRGWNVVSNEATEIGRGVQLVTKGTQLIVIVAYR